MATGSLQKKRGMYYAACRLVGDSKQRWIPAHIPVDGNNKRKAQSKLNEILDDLRKDEDRIESEKLLEVYAVRNEQKKNKYNAETPCNWLSKMNMV